MRVVRSLCHVLRGVMLRRCFACCVRVLRAACCVSALRGVFVTCIPIKQGASAEIQIFDVNLQKFLGQNAGRNFCG